MLLLLALFHSNPIAMTARLYSLPGRSQKILLVDVDIKRFSCHGNMSVMSPLYHVTHIQQDQPTSSQLLNTSYSSSMN